MMKPFALALLSSVITVSLAFAQDPKEKVATVAQPGKSSVTALMVGVTISRHLGDKVLSSAPYEIAVIPGQRASLRMGGDVPIPTTTITPAPKDEPNAKPTSLSSYSYRSIGTNIDVSASTGPDGQYSFTITIEETSVYPNELAPPTTKTTGAPAFRRFSSTNPLSLRDGQKIEYTMATDRLTGEVARVSVSLRVEK